MMEERFEAYLPSNMRKPHIKDKYDNCPICDYPFNTLKQAEEVAEWLNMNTKQYKRFVLRESMSMDRKGVYTVWDNKTNNTIPFIPQISSSNFRLELEKWIDWLNSLVEE